MTSDQGPLDPKKGKRLAPDELARDIASRLKMSGGSHVAERRFLPRFDLLNAGRLIMGFGALLLGAALIAGFSWLSGLSSYETPGTVIESSPVYACPGGDRLGEVFEGEAITVIGRSPDQIWLVLRDNRGPGNRAYVLQSAIKVEGDLTLLSTRECQPGDGQPIAAGQTIPPGESSTTVSTIPTTTTPGRDDNQRSFQSADTGAPASKLAEPGHDLYDDTTRGDHHHETRRHHHNSPRCHHDDPRRLDDIHVRFFDLDLDLDLLIHVHLDVDHYVYDHSGHINNDHLPGDDHNDRGNDDHDLTGPPRWRRFRQLVPCSQPSRGIPADLVHAQTDT